MEEFISHFFACRQAPLHCMIKFFLFSMRAFSIDM
jgi:hypothetical protein